MSLINFLFIAAVALVCGTLAQISSSYLRGGWFINIGAAFFGALAGFFVASFLPVPPVYVLKIKTVSFPIIWAVIGSVVFIAVASLFVKPSR